MPSQDTPQSNNELEEVLKTVILYAHNSGRTREEAKAAINNLLIKARMNEIGTIPVEHGSFVTSTYVNGHQQSVQSRYDELESQLTEEKHD
jgi:hypothetical protein